MQIIFLSGTKCLWLPQYVYQFLVWHKKFGLAQNILGPVKGQGINLLFFVCRIKEQFQYDKRFHPSVIGTILLVFSLSVAYFISYMEGYNYFNALYACFITYSTIGFGDIDIFVSTATGVLS